MPVSYDFSGKAVLVTGGTRGIGAATVRGFLAAGARVAVNGRGSQSIQRMIESLGSCAVIAAPGDIGTVAGCRSAVGAAVAAFGGLDVLVNNAGVFREVLMEDSDEAFWDQTLDINLKGTFFASQAALPSLRQRRGNIVNVASESGLMGNPRCTVYCASKGGVTNLTRAMAIELAPDVRVNAVCPGPIETDMTRTGAPAGVDYEEYHQALTQYPYLKRIGTPEEVADAILYLASDAAAFVTGAMLSIDGGSTVGR
jgi:meso-butanediol dehydrogenase/(S,S)-butanediol dehydrogenase/diacetyl reductase